MPGERAGSRVPEGTSNSRLEAFCDGVFGIALTLLIIDIRLPDTPIASVPELWRALGDLVPSALAFLLSFAVILVTWVNHHAALRLVRGSSASFIYANGFLLLTVVCVPFPTSLLGRFIGTDHAAPAVVIYNAALVAQAAGWWLTMSAALSNDLGAHHTAVAMLREYRSRSIGAMGLYGALAVVAIWLPVTSATVTTLTWVFWLILGMRAKAHE